MDQFASKGFEVPLEEIASGAGVGIATLYRHFPSRDHLARELVRRSLEPIAGFAARAASAEQDPVVALRSLLLYGSELHTTSRAMAQLWRTVEDRVAMDAIVATGLYESAQRLLISGKAEGAIRRDITVEDVARIFYAVAGVVEAGNERAWRRVVEIHLRGMAPAPEGVSEEAEDNSHFFGYKPSAHLRNESEFQMPAILFGSISTIADTSELQRQAFNEAFEEHGLDWHWEREDYLALLEKSGGKQRIADHAESLGEQVDASAVHESKSKRFQENLANSGVSTRPGVVETIRDAKEQGYKIALVTTTSQANVSALLQALSSELDSGDFDLIVDASSVEQPKPEKDAYVFALENLDEQVGDCVAIEDNLGGLAAAKAAGLACGAFPNENTSRHKFDQADKRLERLSLDDLRPPSQPTPAA